MPSRRRCRALVGPFAIIGFLAGTGTPLADSVTRNDDGTLTVDAREVPIGTILLELASEIPFQQLMLDPKVEGYTVTVHLERVGSREALEVVLERSKLDFVILGGGSSRQPWRVFVGDLENAVPLSVGTPRDTGVSDEDIPKIPNRLPERRPPAPDEDGGEEALRRHIAALAAAAVRQPTTNDESNAELEVYATEQFTMYGESVVYHDPNFVTYKNSEEARRARMNTDVSKIP